MLSNHIRDFLSELEIGEIKTYRNLVLLPLYNSKKITGSYLTLDDALQQEVLEITEVDNAGSVPELKVANSADIPVLILDGEELKGAKQNRILNATVLIKEKSVIIVSVSCTEQGRWSYNSSTFKASGNLYSPKMRGEKVRSVIRSLNRTGRFKADQSQVWSRIRESSFKLKVSSRTDAMNDIYIAMQENLKKYTDNYEIEENQVGICVFINGELIGMDVIPDHKLYSKFHYKLVRSYAFDAVADNIDTKETNYKAEFQKFLMDIANCHEEKYNSVGYGCDHRLLNKSVVGSVLIHNEEIIHLAIFKTPDSGYIRIDNKPGLFR